jgi:hypothetical protein
MKDVPRHVFRVKPKFCSGLKPSLIIVRCPTCGFPHEEYFGPGDRDEQAAELQMLRRELEAAAAIIAERSPAAMVETRRKRSKPRRRR